MSHIQKSLRSIGKPSTGVESNVLANLAYGNFYTIIIFHLL